MLASCPVLLLFLISADHASFFSFKFDFVAIYIKSSVYFVIFFPQVYELWSRYNRSPYPSTLYVTLKALPQESGGELGETHQVHGRSVDPTLAEVGSQTFEQLTYKQQHTKRWVH